ncbi:hypothetical protein T05_8552 [Trichinella murrelli]|uniref:Uncharacterized protein n=1 Tax=Trichinella murrelli TaxID=144512 RepID=A0A0V0TML1_9BILA|nr:hypothetical protein T05_8552 [Trichinella murrelli]
MSHAVCCESQYKRLFNNACSVRMIIHVCTVSSVKLALLLIDSVVYDNDFCHLVGMNLKSRHLMSTSNANSSQARDAHGPLRDSLAL